MEKKQWLGGIREYWKKWNQVCLNQVSWENDRIECDHTTPAKIANSKVTVLTVEPIHQL